MSDNHPRVIRGGASPVFSDEEVIGIADKLIDLAADDDPTRFDALMADADAQSAAIASLPDSATLADLAELATPLIEHFPDLVAEWDTARRITLLTGAARLRRYATNDKIEFQAFVLTVLDRTNEHDPNLAVHW